MSLFYAATAIVLWSSLGFLSTTLTHVPPLFLLGCSLAIGSLPGLSDWRTWSKDFKLLGIGVTGIFGYHLFLFLAFRAGPPMEINLINYLWPILIIFLSPLFLRDHRLRPLHVLGGLVAFAGTEFAISHGKFEFETKYLLGYSFAFFAAVIWSLYSVLSKRLSFPTTLVGAFCAISAFLAFAFHWFLEDSIRISGADMARISILGLGPMGLAFYCWNKALTTGDVKIIGLLAFSTPILSTLFFVVFGNRPLTSSIFVGAASIVAGAIMGSFPDKRSKRPLTL